MNVTICPPATANVWPESTPIFGDRHREPVSVAFEADGALSSTGIAFEDFSRMHQEIRKISGARRLVTPTWATNTAELRTLLVRFMERRAGIKTPGAGSLVQRLNAAQQKLLASLPRKVEVLDCLCREHQEARHTDPARARLLASEIQNLDTNIRLTKMGPGVIARMVHLFYGCGCDSVGVASEIGCHPVLVRQTLHRLRRLEKNPKPTRLCRCGAVLAKRRIKCNDCVGPVYRAFGILSG